ncbi:MAG: transketolase [Alphaproteobacteria bacterium 33-17]|nr:MAG: transketolase [Alphaproteobacteria bacterium 33-17]
MANSIRILAADAVEKAKSGHPGMPMGMADIAAVLFSSVLKFNPKDPKWPNRDRFILSNGHGSMLQYALLHFLGYGLTIDDIKQFRQLDSRTPGHPEYGHTIGVETTTGPLGQGMANAVGMAIAAKKLASKVGSDVINHKIFVTLGDGCLMEGISHEASSLAGHLNLDNLVFIFDDNSISIDGATSLTVSEDIINRYKAYGFEVEIIDGHNHSQIKKALENARNSKKPYFIAAKTKIGFGAPTKEASEKSHGAPLGESEIQGLRDKLGWSHTPFEIPEDVYKLWQEAAENGSSEYEAWQNAIKNKNLSENDFTAKPKDFEANLNKAIAELKEHLKTNTAPEASRQSSGNTIEYLGKYLDTLLGGSADLTGSNNTKTKTHKIIGANDFSGAYVHYGVREHGMAAMMNGMAVYGNVIPYSGTFLVFADYMKPAIRLSALMNQHVIYVLTHDSIGVGEDGPTHQPIEHLAMLRSIPHMTVLRPCDAVETMEAWEFALKHNGPSALILTRQNLRRLKTDLDNNQVQKGAYKVYGSDNADIQILATGSEVGVAVDSAIELEAKGHKVNVISMPSMELFVKQSEEYRKSVLNPNSQKVAIEAGISLGWERFIGDNGIFIGMSDFGKSAPGNVLFEHFGFTKENVVNKVLAKMGK